MTRDPSDGSVREDTSKLRAPDHQPKALETKAYGAESPVLITTTSGLPINKQRADYLERLERSRDWLSKYRTDPEGALRRMGETDWVNPETGQTDLLND